MGPSTGDGALFAVEPPVKLKWQGFEMRVRVDVQVERHFVALAGAG
jgi:hypothetical protein